MLSGAPAQAHDFQLTEVVFEITAPASEEANAGPSTFQADLRCDLDALALGADPTTETAILVEQLVAESQAALEARLQRLRTLFERRVRVRFDGEPQPFTVSFPNSGEEDTFLGLTARLTGTVPARAEGFTFFASRAFPPVRLILEGPEGTIVHTLERGGESPAIEVASAARKPVGLLQTLATYVRLGFEHIIPLGVDHILFVLGLFLLGCRWRPLLWQVSAFTLAHTLTLALAIFGVVSLPAQPVEVLIALSISWVAIENIWTERLQPWRPALVFAFGLLHGLGFAGVLGELGLPTGQTIPALLAFNVGVELGQLAVLALALVLLGPWRNRPWYRRRIAIPLSAAIALIGLYWAVERMLG